MIAVGNTFSLGVSASSVSASVSSTEVKITPGIKPHHHLEHQWQKTMLIHAVISVLLTSVLVINVLLLGCFKARHL